MVISLRGFPCLVLPTVSFLMASLALPSPDLAVAGEVKVLAPGVRGAEGEEKGKGVAVRRGPKEAVGKTATRGTRTSSEAVRPGELANNNEARCDQRPKQ